MSKPTIIGYHRRYSNDFQIVAALLEHPTPSILDAFEHAYTGRQLIVVEQQEIAYGVELTGKVIYTKKPCR